ncbi:MAG TPA: LDL receptor domain-containing protein [Enhygromyxa sp.]|nr:LDL receptor domain-containing protein [Enhygromyxa sp.]
MPVKIRLLGLSLLVLFPLASGCAPEAEPDTDAEVEPLGTIGTRYLEYLDLVDDVNRFHCDCGAKAGDFASVDECIAYIGGPVVPPLLAECYARTFDDFEQTRDHVECVAGAFETMLACLDAAGCGGDPVACQQQANVGACPSPSYEFDAAVAENCLGYSLPPAFECADGTKIVPWLECNFTPDCADGSDERVDCPGAHACMDGTIISQEWLCDGFQDCSGGDDELNCE